MDQIHNNMVMNSQHLDRVFSALADPTRRGILTGLAAGERNVRQLTASFGISQPAISRHLRVLAAADLIRREKRGRETFVSVKSEAAEDAARWIIHHAEFWRHHFDQMDRLLAGRKQENSND